MCCLLIVDVQIDFLPGGALAVPHGDAVVAVANGLMPAYQHVVASQDWHPANHLSFASQHAGKRPGDVIQLGGHSQVLWPDHCVGGTRGAEFAPGLTTQFIDYVVKKGTDPAIDSYSAFFDNQRRKSTKLDTHLRDLNIKSVHLLGLATDYCVLATALDACELGFDVTLILEGVRGVELQQGDCERAIETMQAAGVKIQS